MNEQPVAGYSGTPLATKLGIKPGIQICVVDAPDGYLKLIEPLPEGTRVVSRLSGNTDMVHIFSSRKVELSIVLRTCRPKLNSTGIVWVSWPKKSAKVPSDITEDTIRELALPLGFVDIKVCAIDAIWSGLKLVIRKELRSS